MNVGHLCAPQLSNTCTVLMMGIKIQSDTLFPWALTWSQTLSSHFQSNGVRLHEKACLVSPARSQGIDTEMGGVLHSLVCPAGSVLFLWSFLCIFSCTLCTELLGVQFAVDKDTAVSECSCLVVGLSVMNQGDQRIQKWARASGFTPWGSAHVLQDLSLCVEVQQICRDPVQAGLLQPAPRKGCLRDTSAMISPMLLGIETVLAEAVAVPLTVGGAWNEIV